MEGIINIIIFIVVVGVSYLIGVLLEDSHYESIKKREKELLNLPVSNLKKVVDPDSVEKAFLVTGVVVISGDYFKQVLTSIISLFGGRLVGYESLLDRGRREAVLRMKHQAAVAGGGGIYNMCFTTTLLDRNQTDNSTGMFEIIAYGTAVKYRRT